MLNFARVYTFSSSVNRFLAAVRKACWNLSLSTESINRRPYTQSHSCFHSNRRSFGAQPGRSVRQRFLHKERKNEELTTTMKVLKANYLYPKIYDKYRKLTIRTVTEMKTIFCLGTKLFKTKRQQDRPRYLRYLTVSANSYKVFARYIIGRPVLKKDGFEWHNLLIHVRN